MNEKGQVKGISEMRGKILSCLLAVVLMLTIMPQMAFADDAAENSDHEKTVRNGICRKNCAGEF